MDDKEKNGFEVYIDPADTFNIKNEKSAYVHKQLLKELSEEILKNLSSIGTDNYGKDYNFLSANRGKNYLITGCRGSGKSTFLHNLVSRLKAPEKASGTSPCKLLCWYEPSSSRGGENYFFLNVVAALKSELDSSYRTMDSSHPEFDFERAACRNLMQKLDQGIARLSHGKAPLSDLSEHNAAMLRKDSADMDEEIRRNYAKIVDKLCTINKIEAYIIAVDDADTNATQCCNVLENLRLYISHPRVIVLVTGDKSINIERVREKYFSEYNSEYHKQDESGREFRMNSAISHAGQYLMKLFPISHQRELCDLLTLARKRIRIPVYLNMRETLHAQPQDLERFSYLKLEDVINKAFYHAISHNMDEIKPYTDLFMRLPLRSILQIIHYWYKKGVLAILKTEIDADKAKKSTKSQISPEDRIQTEYVVRTSIEHVLKDELSAVYYDFDNLNTDDGKIFYATMLKHCQKMDDLEHGYFLSGDMGSTSEDKYLTMLLAVSFKERIKDLRGFISYLLFGPATVALYAKALEQYTGSTTDRTLKTLSDLRKKFESYLHVGSWHSASRWARHANMIWCADTGLEGLHSGILRIRNSEMIKSINENVLKDSFSPDNESDDAEKKLYQAVALLVCMSRSHERDNSYFISIFSYLAFIHRCLQACQNYRTCGTEAIDAIVGIIENYFPIKTCGKPEWQMERVTVKTYNTESIGFWDEKEPGKTSIPDDVKTKLRCLAKKIQKWYKTEVLQAQEFIEDRDISAQLMGEIWSNFYYALRRISHILQTKHAEEERESEMPDCKKCCIQRKNQQTYRIVSDQELLSKFKDTITHFRNHFCIPDKVEKKLRSVVKELEKLTQIFEHDSFRGAIKELTVLLKEEDWWSNEEKLCRLINTFDKMLFNLSSLSVPQQEELIRSWSQLIGLVLSVDAEKHIKAFEKKALLLIKNSKPGEVQTAFNKLSNLVLKKLKKGKKNPPAKNEYMPKKQSEVFLYLIHRFPLSIALEEVVEKMSSSCANGVMDESSH